MEMNLGSTSHRKLRSFLDLSGLGGKGVIVLFCSDTDKHNILVEFVKFFPDRHLFTSATVSARDIQLYDVLTSHYELASRVVEKFQKAGA